MIENWEFCNLLGIFRRIGFKARLVNCREAAYLNQWLKADEELTQIKWILGIEPA